MNDGCTIFVLAHPDDEVLFWPLVVRSDQSRLKLVFVTDGSAGGAHDPNVRANETRRMLGRLGVDPAVAVFLGMQHGIRDGVLHEQLGEAWAALRTFSDVHRPAAIHTHAWEGGHQDHDCCHVLALALAEAHSVGRTGQVPCYRRPDRGPAPFSLLDPIDANGSPQRLRMTVAERRAMASSVYRYPTQWKSWVGLGPPLLTRLALSSTYPLQFASIHRLDERPHSGPLLYEARGGPGFSAVQLAISRYMKAV